MFSHFNLYNVTNVPENIFVLFNLLADSKTVSWRRILKTTENAPGIEYQIDSVFFKNLFRSARSKVFNDQLLSISENYSSLKFSTWNLYKTKSLADTEELGFSAFHDLDALMFSLCSEYLRTSLVSFRTLAPWESSLKRASIYKDIISVERELRNKNVLFVLSSFYYGIMKKFYADIRGAWKISKCLLLCWKIKKNIQSL